jgi:two-component system, chemotaxis family, chemotaxis protein CheY
MIPIRNLYLPALIRTPRPLDLTALSILIIDDQPFFRALLSEVLRSLGVGNIELAVDGEDGFAALTDHRPDVVITDWMMPKLDGLDLTRRIRSLPDEALQKLPIILVTARTEQGQITQARGAGIDEFVLKPISAKSICDRLREVIEKPRPFISFQNYTGPCRRGRKGSSFSGPCRRFDDPFEIAGSEDEILAEGLMSVFVAASAHVQNLIKGLAQSNANLRSIHMAISEMQTIAEDMSDPHLERVCDLLLGFVTLMSKSGKSAPSLIQAHLSAIEILLRTPQFQIKIRDGIVCDLERMMKRPAAA